jgi:hypothetical protein
MATFRVTDPAGKVHTKSSKARIYSHAVIRQHVGTDYYFVSFASSQAKAEAEAGVHKTQMSYIAVVPTETEEQEK